MRLAIIQARMSSSRLPGKVLKPVKNMTILEYELERVKQSVEIDKIVVATSDDASDNIIEEILSRKYIDVYRGSLNNVLERFYKCSLNYNPDHVIRITADCPLIDPKITDAVIKLHLESDADYTSNVLPRTFPDGLDIEVMKFSTLEKVYNCAKEQDEIEHVTKYIHKYPDKFKISNLKYHTDLSNVRWTLDTLEDYEKLKQIIESFENNTFCLEDIITKFK